MSYKHYIVINICLSSSMPASSSPWGLCGSCNGVWHGGIYSLYLGYVFKGTSTVRVWSSLRRSCHSAMYDRLRFLLAASQLIIFTQKAGVHTDISEKNKHLVDIQNTYISLFFILGDILIQYDVTHFFLCNSKNYTSNT